MEEKDEWTVARPSHWGGIVDPSLAVSRRIVALPIRVKRFFVVMMVTLVASFVIWEITLPYCDAGMEDLIRPASDFCRSCPFRGHCLQGIFLRCDPGYELGAERCVPKDSEATRLQEEAFNRGVTEILAADMCESDFSWGPMRYMMSHDRLRQLVSEHPNNEQMVGGASGVDKAFEVLHAEADASRGRAWPAPLNHWLVRLGEVRINGEHQEIKYEKAYSLTRLPFNAPLFCQFEHYSRTLFLMNGEAMGYLITTFFVGLFLLMVSSNMPKAREEHRQRERLVQRAQQLLTECRQREINSRTLRDLVIVNPEDEQAARESPPSEYVWGEVMRGVRSILGEDEQ